jgi:diguanylate cyclase (GGDEF)-like protein
MLLADLLFKPSMTKRLTVVLAILVGLAVFSILQLASDAIDKDLTKNLNARVLEVSGGAAANLNARLLAVDAIVENAAAGDGRAGSLLIRQRLLRSPAISNVAIISWLDAFSNHDRAPVKLDATDRRLLSSGQARLFSQVAHGSSQALYLVRALTIGGTAAVVFCEISPEWLWKGISPVSSGAAVVVMDPTGLLLQATAAIPESLLSQLRAEREISPDATAPVARNWGAGEQQWQGAVARLELNGAQLAANRWLVISFVEHKSGSPGMEMLKSQLPWLFAASFALILLMVMYLRLGWEPPLASLRVALAALGEGRYQRITPRYAVDSPRRLAIEFNRAVDQLQDRMQILASLNDIDRKLMHTADLEPSLDEVLNKVCVVSECHGAALTLIDPDAQGYARSYVVASSGIEMPVSRISVDNNIVQELAPQLQGVSIAQPEAVKHSFLLPLRSIGAEFFWVWPVLSGGQAVAILSVGYVGSPEVPAELARFGSECAVRLGVALSKSARDDELYRQAHFDALTSLPNRLLFRDRLAQELVNAGNGLQRGALLYVDLDHFKKVNDSMGHAAGDQVLQIVAQRLRTCVKDGDTVARLGGDEFTVILRAIGSPEAARQISRRIIESLQQPVNIGGRDHHVCASIGVTMFPDDGSTIEDLMRNADTAMYQAKEGGRSREMFYNRTMEAAAIGAVETSLLRALRRREFLLHYQPQYSTLDGSMVGIEALLRWQPPKEALRFPAEFIQTAEQTGIIVDIGSWVLETVCKQYAQWRSHGIAPPRVAVNVSVHQLRHADFPALVKRTLEHSGLRPEMLELELTETVFADADAKESLRKLSAIGVRLALDDFGTGYSSLGYLREHPVQVIKIDRSFVEGVATNATAATLAETIITMAHALGKVVVAEGVETQEQLEFLRERRCDAAQGYYFARPMPVSAVDDMLRSRSGSVFDSLRAAG